MYRYDDYMFPKYYENWTPTPETKKPPKQKKVVGFNTIPTSSLTGSYMPMSSLPPDVNCRHVTTPTPNFMPRNDQKSSQEAKVIHYTYPGYANDTCSKSNPSPVQYQIHPQCSSACVKVDTIVNPAYQTTVQPPCQPNYYPHYNIPAVVTYRPYCVGCYKKAQQRQPDCAAKIGRFAISYAEKVEPAIHSLCNSVENFMYFCTRKATSLMNTCISDNEYRQKQHRQFYFSN